MWVDMVCNHHTPIPLRRGPKDEALMFRVSESQEESHELTIEIQWDNGGSELIRPNSITELGDWIETYYMLNIGTDSKRIHDRKVEGDRVSSRNPILVSKLRTACYWIGTKTATYLNAPTNAAGFKRLKADELSKTKMMEQESYIQKINKILRRHGLHSVDDLLQSQEAKDDEDLKEIDSLYAEDQIIKEADLLKFKEHLKFFNEFKDLSFLSTDNERLGMIKSDMDAVFRHIALESLDLKVITVSSKIVYDMVIEMADLLIDIAQDSASHGNWIRSEFSYRVRSVMQSIFREVHDASLPK